MYIWKALISFSCLTLIMLGFQNCAPVHEGVMNSSSYLSGGDEAQTLNKFSTTLYPTLRANCAKCHGISQSPMFAVADPATSMKIIFQNDLVDLSSPSNSWFVQKIAGGHNSFPSSLAMQIQGDIQSWADSLDPTELPAEEPPVPAPDNVAPSVIISSPVADANLEGDVTVSAVASDNVGVSGVQFYVDGVSQGAEDTTFPYSVTWRVSSLSNRSYSLRARARDEAGNTSQSEILVNVNNPVDPPTDENPADQSPPSVTISSPSSDSNVEGSVTVNATASDNVGVVGVQLYVNGSTYGSEDLSAPYSITWNASSLSNGTYSLRLRARDAAGNITNSSTISVNVNNPVEEPPQNSMATFSWISQNVLIPKCVSCHGGSRPESGISFDTYSKTMSTVRAGDGARSTLYKIINSGEMPPGRDDVNAEQLQAIFDWIQSGAPNN